ncbi:MAG: LysM peptidoglycan-binding domain-containing protein [Acidimicrobiales bacterium]|nr:LysM peptidoglycan-binding domain-containing protein [Acidimicrobiales bacterium]
MGHSHRCRRDRGRDQPAGSRHRRRWPTDYAEVNWITDPLDPDTDGGGAWDGEEYKKTDPLDPSDDIIPDRDSDGLGDHVEDELGTNPDDADRNKDGLTDGDEVLVHKTLPLRANSDGGSVNDGDEIHNGTDPMNPIDDVAKEEPQPEPEPEPEPTDYVVSKGDTFNSIAGRYQVTVPEILAVNPQITNPDMIMTGAIIMVPKSELEGPVPADMVIERGQTLQTIAAEHGLTLTELMAANPQIANPDLMRIGDTVTVPPSDADEAAQGVVVVRSGDTLWNISQTHGHKLADVLAINPTITNPDLIFPRQRILLPVKR